MTAATTVKVAPDVRDQLNELAAAEGMSAGSMVEKLLREYLWRHQVEQAKAQMRTASPEEWSEYLAEAAEWDLLSADEPLDLQ